MKIRFAASPFLSSMLPFSSKLPVIFTIPVFLGLTLPAPSEAAAKELVYLSQVEVAKVKDGKFKVTASGDAPSAGWKVKLEPVTYIKEPDNWIINANGIRPDGPSATMMTPWKDSIELSLGPTTKKITVNGRRGKSISADVPHESTGGMPKDKDTGKDKKDSNRGK